jgi:hypothetical protein
MAPIVVLFGANDAGKTNTLEAIEPLNWVEPDHQRIDQFLHEREEPECNALTEFEGLLDGNSQDADVLGGLLHVRHLPPIFQRRTGAGVVLEDNGAKQMSRIWLS